MAVDLTQAPVHTVYRGALSTLWLQVKLPQNCRVTVIPEGTSAYIAFASNGAPASAETPADAGAVGSHRFPLAADGPYTFRCGSSSREPGPISIFLAATSGTPNFSLMIEDLEQ